MQQTKWKIRRDLPWGYWLIYDGSKFRDEQGNTWGSEREAFWASLNMADSGSLEEDSERLFRILHAISGRGTVSSFEVELQLAGSLVFRDFYNRWLWLAGLIGGDRMPRLTSDLHLSDLGHSVRLMLEMTQKEEFKTLPLEEFAAILEAKSRNVSAAEDVLVDFERRAAGWPHHAARATIGNQHLVQLISADSMNARRSNVAMRQVVWTLSFDCRADRDAFFAWMCGQSDHWAQWGGIAHWRGASALTEVLLRSFAMNHIQGEPCRFPGAQGGCP